QVQIGKRAALALAALVGLSVLVSMTAPLLALVVLSAIGVAVGLSRAANPTALPTAMVGAALLTAWWCGLFAATPCYRPYPRLLLPWLLAAWLGAAIVLDEFVSLLAASQQSHDQGRQRRNFWLAWGGAVASLLIGLPIGGLCK